MHRLARLFAISAVLAASIVGLGAAPANAQVLCEEAWLGGSLINPPTEATECFDQIVASMCVYQHAGFDQSLSVAVFVCVPAPLAGP
jgi:hypothetical protein